MRVGGVEAPRAVADELWSVGAVAFQVVGVETPQTVAVEELSVGDAGGLAVVESPQAASVAAGAVPCSVGEIAECFLHRPEFDSVCRYDFQHFQLRNVLELVHCWTVPEPEETILYSISHLHCGLAGDH